MIKMKTVRLGKTGLIVSRVGIGGIPITRPTENEAIKVIRRALDLGVNFVDTARSYKDSEDRIGKAIAGCRDRVVVATKGGGQNKKSALKSLELSLQHLNTSYIDLWQLHGINTLKEYENILRSGGALDAAREALRGGKIGHVGLSSHNVNVALKAVSSDLFETILFPFNFISNEAADRLVSLAKEHDVGFIAMKTFAGSRIDDANLAIKYLLQFDNVVPVPGVEKVKEVEEIINVVNGSWKLTASERKRIREIHEHMSPRFCRQCEECLPCPQGVPIHALMYLINLYELWPPDWFFSWRYVTDSTAKAKGCDQCGECEKNCPYNLPIREMMKENIEFYERMLEKWKINDSRRRS
jgi:predicted aldo/keto reductase-like oxidoreductase